MAKVKDEIERNAATIKGRIDFYKNRYKDRVGAQFFLNLCEEGPTAIINFFTRYAAYGYNMELNEVEQRALTKAGEVTGMDRRVENVSTVRNAMATTFTRRGMALGLGGATAILLSFGLGKAQEGLADASDHINQTAAEGMASRVLTRVQDKVTGEINTNFLHAAIQEELAAQRELMREGAALGSVVLPVITAGLVFGALATNSMLEGHKESVKKTESIIRDLDLFCNTKLNRIPGVAAVGEGFTSPG